MAKVIAVFGATGQQGGGVVTALLKNKNFEVRAVTRNAKSDKAKALEKQGANIVEGNLDNPKSLASVLSGCHGVFGMTNFDLLDADKEIQQGKNLVDGCKAAGVKHLIFSGAHDIKGGVGKPCAFSDSKVDIANYMFASGVPSTNVRYLFFAENFIGGFGGGFKGLVQKDDKGTFVIAIPMEGKPMDYIVVSGAGNAIAAIFASPEAYIGKSIGISGDHITVQEIADIFSKHLAPKTFKAGEVTAEQFSKSGQPGAEHYGAMFEYFQSGQADIHLELTKQLDPTTMRFEDWVKANKDALNAIYQ
ncbi:nmrA-like family domain-containing protein 1 [Amphiura filiformis]|uniref:nmrA-like family domain-containing protein 1 n=1 Tax=Amphiura filiformis TaxID=82378 RepID=UPI003B21A4BB